MRGEYILKLGGYTRVMGLGFKRTNILTCSSTNAARHALGMPLVLTGRYGEGPRPGIPAPAAVHNIDALSVPQIKSLLAYHLRVPIDVLPGHSAAELLPALRHVMGLEYISNHDEI